MAERLEFELVGVDVSASRILQEVAREAQRTGRALNDLRNVNTTVRVDIVPERALDALRQDLERIGGERQVRVRLELGDALRDLDRLSYALNDLAYRDAPTVNIEVSIDSILEVRQLNELLDRIDREINVDINVDRDGGAGETVNRLSESLRGLGAAGANVQEHLRSTGGQMLGLGTTAGTTGVKLVAAAQSLSYVGQFAAQAGAGAGILAPALLTAAQAMGTVKLVGDEASKRLQTLQPQFDGIKSAAAAAFGPKFSMALKEFSSDLPVVQEGVRKTAGVLGDLSVAAAHAFSGPAFRKDLADIMDANAQATANLGFAGIDLGEAFFDVAVAAKDVWVNLTRNLNVGADSIAQWVAAKRQSGELTAAIQKGADSIGDIFRAIWNFAVGVKSLFAAVGGDASNFSDTLVNLSQKFRDWATSAGTVNGVSQFFKDLRAAAGLAKDAIADAATEFKTGFQTGEVADGATGLSLVFQTFGVRARAVADLVKNELWPTLKSVGAVIRDDVLPIVSKLSLIFSDVVNAAIAGVARIIRDDLVPILQQLAPFVRDDVVPAVQSLAQWVKDELFPAVERIAGSIKDNFLPALASVRQAIEDNKPQLQAFWQGLKDVADVILTVVEFAIKVNLATSIRTAGEAITLIIKGLALFVEALAQVAVGALNMALIALGAFKEVALGALSMVSGVVNTMAKLPGPLGAPWRSAQEAINAYRTNVDTQLTAAEGRVRAARDGINGWLDGIKDKTVTITVKEKRELEYFSKTSPNAPGLTFYAKGGKPRMGEWSIVGEQGPELVRWGAAGAKVFDAVRSARMLDTAASPRTMATARQSAPAYGGRSGSPAPVIVVNVTQHVHGSVTTQQQLAEDMAPLVRNAIKNGPAGASSNARKTGL